MTPAITLTLLGHSCVLVEVVRPDGSTARLLLDPGNLTPALHGLPAVDAVLVTHAHPDHLDVIQLGRLGNVTVHGDTTVAAEVGSSASVRTLREGRHRVAGIDVVAAAAAHEEIYPGVPLPSTLTFMIAGAVYAPGDALTVPDSDVEVLLLPLGAPWMKLSEGIHFLRAVHPRVAVPVHDSGLAPAHRALHRAMLTRFAPKDTTVVALEPGEPYAV